MSSTTKINVKPFLLNSETENQPSYFEILFLINNIRYRYGFEVDENIVHSEWLFERKSKKEHPLFFRDKDKIEITKDFPEGKGIEERTRENALFLAAVDQWNGKISQQIYQWFTVGPFFVFSGLAHNDTRSLTIDLNSEPPESNHEINDFLHQFDLGFSKFRVDPPYSFKTYQDDDPILTHHNKYDSTGNIIGNKWFDLNKQESSGTNKIFDIAGYIMIGLQVGNIIIIDELDAKLHPLLTIAIVKLFNSREHNPKNAQLIFATHDTNLLSYGGFRRDQVYFTEKNQFEETDLYSLVEYKDDNGVRPRNDRSFEKDYINGRYGAIPFIGDFSNLINNGQGIEA
jgi:hypothetical protein